MNQETITFKVLTWRNTWLMKPENYSRFGWELFVMFFLIALGFLLPYANAFEPDNSELSDIVDYLSYSIFSLDILINFNTGFYEKGVLIMDRVKIFRDYFSFWFWVDIISTLPIDRIVEGNNSSGSKSSSLLKYIRVLRVLKLLKLIRLTKLKLMIIKIKDRISNKKVLSLVTVLKLLLYLLLIAHFFACLMYTISNERMGPDSFMYEVLNKTGKQLTSNGEIYLTCLYWAITTMSSIGYGDIFPVSTNERMLGIIAMICSSLTFGFIIGNIGSIVEKQGLKEKERRETLTELNYYMRIHNFSQNLKAKTRNFMEYSFAHQKKSSMKTIEMLSMLSEVLQQEILENTNGYMITSKAFFKDLDKNFISKLTRILEVHIFSPSDFLIKEGYYPKGMFFIINGFVKVYDEGTKSKIKNLSEGDTVGEIGLFTKEKCVATVIAAGFVETYFIDIDVFYQIIDLYPGVKQLVANIKESCEEGNYTALHVKCYMCRKLGHIAKHCNQLRNDEEIKKRWLKRNFYGKPFKPQSKPKRETRNIFSRYSKINVVGKQRKPKEMFPHSSGILQSLHKYFSRMRHSSNSHCYQPFNYTDESIRSSNSSMDGTVHFRIDKINYLFSNSDEEPIQEQVRSQDFNMMLLK